MDGSKSSKLDLKRLCQGGALCGVPVGGMAPTEMLGAAAPGEMVTITLALGAFVGAGIWTFRKWGKSAGTSPEEAPESQPEGGLATS